MATIYGTCKKCGSRLDQIVNVGFFYCPGCQKKYYRWFNPKTETYEIDEVGNER